MAPARKKSASISRSILDQDKYTAELSSGQLVIGITILLVFGLACFLLGVLVGKFEPVERQELAKAEENAIASDSPTVREGNSAKRVNAQPAHAAPSESQAKSSRRASRDQNVAISKANTSKEGNVASTVPPQETVKGPPAITKASPEENSTGAKPVNFPGPTDSPRASVADPVVKPAKATAQPGKPQVEPVAKAASPAEVAVKPKAHKPDAPKHADGPKESKPPKQPDPPKETQVAKAPNVRVSSPHWAVQIVSLAKKANAPKVLLEVESKSPYKVQLRESNDGRLVAVLAGHFDTREEAEKARDVIRKKLPQFADCFPIHVKSDE